MKALISCTVLAALLLGSVAVAQEAPADKLAQAMGALKEKSAALGAAKAEGVGLYFGATKINGNYEIVDAIKDKYGCVATFFVKKDDGFIRISTNVQKEGNRAVGTKLDPAGKAIIAIQKGETFKGEADILGVKHDTVYEPIKNAAGEVVGIYFVGVAKG